MTAPRPAKILVVEDDPGIAALERARLEEAGYRVVVAPDADDALLVVSRGGVDLVLLDYRLPRGVDGLDLYARIKAIGFDLPVILVTGASDEGTVIRAFRVGVRDFVTKSIEYLDYLPEAVGRVLRQVATERRLAESEARLAGVIQSTKDAVIVVEADRRVSLFNPAAEQMFRCPATAALGRPLTHFIPNEVAADEGTAGEPSLTNRIRRGTRGVRATGEEFPLEATVSPGKVGKDKFYTVVVRDVTERQQAEDALRRSEAMLRRAEAMAHVAGWTYEVATGVYVSSEEGARIGGTAPGPHTAAELAPAVHPDDRARLEAAMADARAGAPFEIEHRLVVGGRVKWVNVRGEPEADAGGRVVRVIGVTQDITARRQLEEQVRQAQKMEAIDRLAGGVAHDFNNLLTVINGYSSLLLRSLPPRDPARDLATEIHKAGERAAELTGQLLSIARPAATEPQVIDPNAVVAEMGNLLRRLVGDGVALTTRLDPAVSRVRADPGQFERVLMNLAANARDAMPGGGRLTVETRDAELGEDYARAHAGVEPGAYVLTAVTDTGVGMPPEVQARLFEPFFTTKKPGAGTGLGLAMVYGIVKQAGGHLDVYSEVGVGTAFKVYLPAVVGPAAAGPPAPVAVRGGTEAVLLVEDQEDVQQFARLALQSYGYTVLTAADGAEALRVLDAHPAVDVLVSDVVMPGMSGPEVAAALRARDPRVGVLFTSGYSDDAIDRHGPVPADAAFLQKPYTPLALARTVRDVLDRRPPG
ncbi:response regulator [bacterium]|nr:response regulator [bacterium]